MIVNEFVGQYRFLSNFIPNTLGFNVEKHYQASKTHVTKEKEWVLSSPNSSTAKSRGRHVTMRVDWDEVKVDIMYSLLRQKFSDPVFRDKLLATGDAELREGNWWGDTFWGICRGQGENMLGKLLMELRTKLTSTLKGL